MPFLQFPASRSTPSAHAFMQNVRVASDTPMLTVRSCRRLSSSHFRHRRRLLAYHRPHHHHEIYVPCPCLSCCSCGAYRWPLQQLQARRLDLLTLPHPPTARQWSSANVRLAAYKAARTLLMRLAYSSSAARVNEQSRIDDGEAASANKHDSALR